ncbi:MAG: hypothetical protein IKR19_08735 [Acholeplasmatales bacterium]|nr:hypothetical protein [Acholeplasmatales bacterium]
MFSILDILHEAEGDENQTNNTPAANDNANNAGTDNQNQNNNQQDTNPAGDNDDAGGNDDFDMDMSLEDDNADDTTDDTSDNSGGDLGGGDMGSDSEPVEANTDMFGALSAEEQIMKISELKNQYAQLYNSCDDLLEKISNINNNEVSIAPLSKLTNTLNDLKKYIIDYLYNQFDSKSFYENDVKLNFFLSIFSSISEVLVDIYKINIQND